MTKLFTDAFMKSLTELRTDIITLSNTDTFKQCKSDYSKAMIINTLSAISKISSNNNANYIKEQLTSSNKTPTLLDTLSLLDGKTGLYIPVIFDDLSLALAKILFNFMEKFEFDKSIEKNASPILSAILTQFNPGKTKAAYVIQLKNQINFFELMKNAQTEGDASEKTFIEMKEVLDAFTKVINPQYLSLDQVETKYNTLVAGYLIKAASYRISYIYSNAFSDAKSPITMAAIFGKEGVAEGFSEGRGGQKIYEGLLNAELAFNKKLIELGLISSSDQCINAVQMAIEKIVSEDSINIILQEANRLISQFDLDQQRYQRGDHLASNKSGLFGSVIGTLHKLAGPDLQKTALLQRLVVNLNTANKNIDKNATTLSHILQLLVIVMKARLKHDNLVANSDNLSLGETSKILNNLCESFTELLLAVNASNERHLLQAMKYAKEDLASIEFPSALSLSK